MALIQERIADALTGRYVAQLEARKAAAAGHGDWPAGRPLPAGYAADVGLNKGGV